MLLKDSLKVIEDLGDLPQRLELDIQLSWKDGMGGFHMVESDGILLHSCHETWPYFPLCWLANREFILAYHNPYNTGSYNPL